MLMASILNIDRGASFMLKTLLIAKGKFYENVPAGEEIL